VAMYDQAKIDELLEDSRIIRNKLKVHSAVTNAQLFLKVQQEFGSFSDYIWSFVGGMPLVNQWKNLGQIPSTTPQSDALSKDLKRRGFKFVGSTIMYAHMQATGLVNDHVTGCFRYEEINEVALQPDFRKSSPELGANPQGSD
jgi:DNA-3-methyladenine glycosylase I